MKYWKRFFSCILVMAFLFCLPAAARAEEWTGSLTIYFHGATDKEADIPLADVPFKLYKIADKKNGEWTLSGDFADADVSLEDMSASGQQTMAEELYYYARMNRLAGVSGETNVDGQAQFLQLQTGLYLVYQAEDKEYEEGIFCSAPFLVSIPMDTGSGDSTYSAVVRPKNEWVSNEDRVIIGLRDLTIYTGGNELTGELDGYPTPRYTGIPEDVTFEMNGEPWDTSRAKYPFAVIYTRGEEQPDLSVEDTYEYIAEDTEAGLYVAHIVPRQRGGVITAVKPDGRSVRVEFTTAILTVRDVLNKESNEQLGVIVSEAEEQKVGEKAEDVLTDRQKNELAHGLAVVTIPEESTIDVNGDATLGVVEIEEAALLFDRLLYYNIMNEETGRTVLVDRAAETLENMGKEMENRQYQSRYLDLVQDQDGNLWLSSSKGSTVIWPYPEGTDENTKFELFHYPGLHREYGIKGNAEESQSVYTAPQEQVEIENTEYGIKFYIPQSGFSPFVLSWVPSDGQDSIDEESGNGGSVNPIDKVIQMVKTGDTTEITVFAAALGISVSVIVIGGVIIHRKKRKK